MGLQRWSLVGGGAAIEGATAVVCVAVLLFGLEDGSGQIIF